MVTNKKLVGADTPNDEFLEHRNIVKPRSHRWIVGIAMGCAWSLLTNPARAVDDTTKASALSHYRNASSAFEQQLYPDAAREFQLAFEQLPLPVTGLWAGRCYVLAGDLVSAKKVFRQTIRLPPDELWIGDKQQQAQRAASHELERLSQPVVNSERQQSTDGIEHQPPRSVPETAGAISDPWRTVGWVSLSAGAAGLAVGAVTGLMLARQHGGLKSNCPGGICNPDAVTQGEVDGHNGLRFVSSVGFVAGSVLSALGVVLVLSSPTNGGKTELALRLAPNGASLKGAF